MDKPDLEKKIQTAPNWMPRNIRNGTVDMQKRRVHYRGFGLRNHFVLIVIL